MLPLFFLCEALEQQKTADPGALPVHRHHRYVDEHILDLHQPHLLIGGTRVAEIRQQGADLSADVHAAGDAGRRGVGCKDPPLHIHADDAHFQSAHQHVQIGFRLQAGVPQGGQTLAGVRQILYVRSEMLAGGEPRKAQMEADLQNGLRGEYPGAQIQHRGELRRYALWFSRRDGHFDPRRHRHAGAVGEQLDLGDAQPVQFRNGLNGHLHTEVHQNGPGPHWQLLQRLDVPLQIGDLGGHRGLVRRKIRRDLLVSIGGGARDEIEIRILGHGGIIVLSHAEAPDLDLLTEQLQKGTLVGCGVGQFLRDQDDALHQIYLLPHFSHHTINGVTPQRNGAIISHQMKPSINVEIQSTVP